MANKKKAQELTIEQKRAAALDSFKQERYGNYSPEPPYEFEIGDKVDIGSLKDVVVCDKFGDGIYEIAYTIEERDRMNRPIFTSNCRRFVYWHEIRPINEAQSESLIKNYDLRLSFMQMSMEGGILGRAYCFGIDFSPEYQRDYVWELSDKVELIDSIFNCVDIGKFVFIKNPYTAQGDSYTILDGKQRCNAILEFYENRFAYKGKYYNDLCKRDQSFFKNYSISIAEVSDISEEQILRYFLKLNKCGRIMDKDHLSAVEQLLEEKESENN